MMERPTLSCGQERLPTCPIRRASGVAQKKVTRTCISRRVKRRQGVLAMSAHHPSLLPVKEDGAGVRLPPLNPLGSNRETLGSVHRLRRTRRKVNGVTQMTDEIELLVGESQLQRRAKAEVQDLVEAVLQTCGDPSLLADALESFAMSQGSLTSRISSEAVKQLCSGGHFREGLALFSELRSSGTLLEKGAYTALIAAASRSGMYTTAESVFAAMKAAGLEPSLHAYTALMQARSQAGNWQEVLSAFQALTGAGFKADTMIYNCVLGACGRAREVGVVSRLWKQMRDEGCQANTGTMALLLSTYIRTRNTDKALEVYFFTRFQGLEMSRDMYKGIICLLAKVDRWPFALDIYREAMSEAMTVMPELRPFFFFSRPIVFNALISSLSRNNQWQGAAEIYGDLCSLGIRPDLFTWSALASALGRAGEYERVMALNREMASRWGLKPNLEVCNATLLACQQRAKWQHAVQLLWQMEQSGVCPDVISFSSAIRACELANQPQPAMRIYQHMTRSFCNPNSFTYGSLIRGLGRAKDWKAAMEMFEVFQLSEASGSFVVLFLARSGRI